LHLVASGLRWAQKVHWLTVRSPGLPTIVNLTGAICLSSCPTLLSVLNRAVSILVKT